MANQNSMLPQTAAAIEAIVNADPSLDKDGKADILKRVFGDRADEQADTLLSVPEVARRIGKTSKTVHVLAAQGVFTKLTFPGQTRSSGILASSVERYFKQSAAKGGAA